MDRTPEWYDIHARLVWCFDDFMINVVMRNGNETTERMNELKQAVLMHAPDSEICMMLMHQIAAYRSFAVRADELSNAVANLVLGSCRDDFFNIRQQFGNVFRQYAVITEYQAQLTEAQCSAVLEGETDDNLSIAMAASGEKRAEWVEVGAKAFEMLMRMNPQAKTALMPITKPSKGIGYWALMVFPSIVSLAILYAILALLIK